MGDHTAIAWTDATWNPVRGCSRVSAGCVNCYAERQAIRHAGPGGAYEGLVRTSNGGPKWTGKITLVPELLDRPLRWRRPRRVFVNSMSDLFHEGVPDEFIDQVFAVMALTPQHTYQILTKRPERMLAYLSNEARSMLVRNEMEHDDILWWRAHERFLNEPDAPWWPLPNVHLGVSVEDQATADERILLLLYTPAAVRFVSYEPALAAVNFRDEWLRGAFLHCQDETEDEDTDECRGCPGWTKPGGDHCGAVRGPHLDWLILGGESGPGARPCDVEWIRSAVRQCREAGVPVFVKQIGARPDGWCKGRLFEPTEDYEAGFCDVHEASEGRHCGSRCAFLTDRKGADPAEWPEDLRVQEFPR